MLAKLSRLHAFISIECNQKHPTAKSGMFLATSNTEWFHWLDFWRSNTTITNSVSGIMYKHGNGTCTSMLAHVYDIFHVCECCTWNVFSNVKCVAFCLSNLRRRQQNETTIDTNLHFATKNAHYACSTTEHAKTRLRVLLFFITYSLRNLLTYCCTYNRCFFHIRDAWLYPL